MLEGTDLKTQQYRQYLEVTLKQARDNLHGLRGQIKLAEDYVAWLEAEIENSKT